MDDTRKFGIVGGIGLLFALTFLLMVTSHPPAFYWGLPAGVFFGLGTCVYLAGAWDPYLLAPKNRSTKRASWKIWWVVPLGIVVARLSSDFLGENIRQILMGAVCAWIYITFLYFIVQAWRYR